jgi:hypothetical protein
LDDLVTGLNSARPYRVVNAARGLVELSAFVYHHTKILKSATIDVSPQTSDIASIIKGILSTVKAASHFAQVTRFNWSAMVRNDMDEFFTAWHIVDERVKATQILTLIDKLPGEEKRSARFFYDMLCDYVHPNVGAHTLVVNKAESISGGQMHWELSREPDSDEALWVLFHTIAIPFRASIQTLLQDLQHLQLARNYFGEWKRRCENVAQGLETPHGEFGCWH